MTSNMNLEIVHHYPAVPVTGKDHVYVALELTAPPMERNKARPPVHVSLVIDRSGSMRGDALEYCKQACASVVTELTEADMFSLIAFNGFAETIIPPQSVQNKQNILAKIQTIKACGGTDLSSGIVESGLHLIDTAEEGYMGRMIILSDGRVNKGTKDVEGFVKLTNYCCSHGMTISALGVQAGFDEELLEAISSEGRGNFYYISSAEDIPGIFEQELSTVLTVTLKNVTFQLAPEEGTEVVGAFGYPMVREKESCSIALGHMYEREKKVLLVELKLQPKEEGIHDIFKVKLSSESAYMEIAEQTTKAVSLPFTRDVLLLSEKPDPRMTKHILITNTGLALSQAMERFDDGDAAAGKEILQKQSEELFQAADVMKDNDLQEEALRLEKETVNFQYDAGTRKRLHENKYRSSRRKKQNKNEAGGL